MAILLQTISDSKQAQADLAKLRASVDTIQTSSEKLANTFSNLGKVIAVGIGAFASISSVLRMTDAITALDSKIKLVTKSQAEFNFALDAIRSTANATRTDLTAIGKLYTRIALNADELGASQKSISRVTESISKAIATSGANVQETASAVTQLGQALGSGTLAGEELKAILENAPALAVQIAKGLGVAVGQLKKLGEEGKLTSVKVFKAILKQQDEIDANFKKVGVTYGQAFANLGTSFSILFAEAKNAILGTSSSWAEAINDIANSIFKFAINFKLTFISAKLIIYNFVTDVILFFASLIQPLQDISKEVSAIAVEMYDKWKPTLINLGKDILEWSLITAAVIVQLSKSFYDSFAKTDIGTAIITATKSAFITVTDFISKGISAITRNIPKIDIMKFIPNLQVGLDYVKAWAIKVESWFAWLYDKVVGNSWIPDLVKQTGDWLGKLLGSPLAFIKSFAEKASISFKGITIAGPIAIAIGILLKFKNTIFIVLGALGLLTAALFGLKEYSKNKINIETGTLGTTIPVPKLSPKEKALETIDKVSTQFNRVKDTLTSQFNKSSFKKALDESAITRTLKQILGLQDTAPGQIFGTQIDTKSAVGRGPQRNNPDRIIGSDLIAAFPLDWQLPLVAGIAAALSLAIYKVFGSGTITSVLVSLVTTLAGIFAAQAIPKKEINDSFAKGGLTFLNLIEKGITALFNGNVLKDPLGFLSVIAKTALLFEAGRAAIKTAALAIATAPTRVAQTGASFVERGLLRKDIAKTNQILSQVPVKLQANVDETRRARLDAFRTLANTVDASGQRVGGRAAVASLNAPNPFETAETRRRTAALRDATAAFEGARTAQRNQADLTGRLQASITESTRRADAITQTLTANRDALRAGFKNIGAGAGGAIGTVAGFQIGTEIAKGMSENTSALAKIGVIITTAIAGQAIGSAIGIAITSAIAYALGLIGSALLAVFGVIGGLLASPFVLGGIAIAAAIAAVLNWDRLAAIFSELKTIFTTYVIPALKSFADTLIDIFKNALKFIFESSPEDIAKKSEIKAARGVLFNQQVTSAKDAVFGRTPESLEKQRAERNQVLDNNLQKLTDTIIDFRNSIIDNSRKSIERKANGGRLSGPGTGTSDSIPAMLSNGEFIVNAEATKNNLGILTAINNGNKISKFSEGGTSSEISGSVQVQKESTLLRDTFQKFLDSIRDIIKNIKENPVVKSLGKGELPGAKGGMPSDFGGSTKGTLEGFLEKKGTTLDLAADKIAKTLTSNEFTGVNQKALKEFAAADPEAFRKAVRLLDEASVALAKSQNTTLPEFLRKEGAKLAKDAFIAVNSILQQRGVAEGPDKFKDTGKEDDSKKAILTFEQELDLINKAFPELGLVSKDFLLITDSVRETILRSAVNTLSAIQKLGKTEIGLLDAGGSALKLPPNILKQRQEIEQLRKDALDAAKISVSPFITEFRNVKRNFEAINLTLTEESFNLLNDLGKNTLEKLRESAQLQFNIVEKPKGEVTEQARSAAQLRFKLIADEITKMLNEAAIRAIGGYGAVKLDLEQFGISLEKSLYNRFSDADRLLLNTYTEQLKAQPKIDENTPEALRKEIVQRTDELTDSIYNLFKIRGKNYKSKAEQAGEAFASSTEEGLSTAIKDFTKGRKTFSEAGKSFLDSFTENVVDTFIKGLTDSFTGKDGLLTKTISQLGTNIFKTGDELKMPGLGIAPIPSYLEEANIPPGEESGVGGFFSSITGFFGSIISLLTGQSTTAAAAPVTITTAIGTSATSIVSAIVALGTSITSALASLKLGGGLGGLGGLGGGGFLNDLGGLEVLGSLGFATGGQIKGPGTGTSDSIPAMLSNGEFIVNAKQSAKHLSLLSAINNGKVKKFAAGGMVGDSGMIGTIASNSNQSASQQVFNINVTGDISRQTKREIISMMPQIATGVNSQNRENNISRRTET